MRIDADTERLHRDRHVARGPNQPHSWRDSSRSEEALAIPGSLAQADVGTRQQALRRLQGSHGNTAVQRLAEVCSPGTPPTGAREHEKVARTPAPSVTVQRFFDGVGEWLTGAAGDVGGTALAGITGIGGALADAAGGVGHGLSEAFGAMTDSGMGVGRALAGGYGAFTDAGGGVIDAMLGGGGPSGVFDAAVGGAGEITGAAGGLWDAVTGHAGATGGAWAGVGSALSSGVGGVAGAAWGGATDVLGAVRGAAGQAQEGLGRDLDPMLWQHGVTLGPKPKYHWSRRPDGEHEADQELAPPPKGPMPQIGEKPALLIPQPHDPMRIEAGDNHSDEEGPDYDYWGRLISETAYGHLSMYR